jgi:hypothetical protein
MSQKEKGIAKPCDFAGKISRDRDYRDNLPINGKDKNECNFRKIEYELTDVLEFSEHGDR